MENPIDDLEERFQALEAKLTLQITAKVLRLIASSALTGADSIQADPKAEAAIKDLG